MAHCEAALRARRNEVALEREFILSLGAAMWPLAAEAQQAVPPVIGFLGTWSPDERARLLAAFHRGLAEKGYTEGRNVIIEYRWVLGHSDRLPFVALELARRPVAALVSTAGELAALAAKTAVPNSPIIFDGTDPVPLACYNRPCGNTVGIMLSETLEPRRLGLLHELVPQASTIGVLLNPNWPPTANQLGDIEAAARTLGVQLLVLRASTDPEVDTAFEFVAQHRIAALAVPVDPFFDTRRDRLVALAARHSVPTMYQFREYSTAGGLMSYGVDRSDLYRRVGVYVGRMLDGTRSRDLPVLQPTKFEFVINLQTAKMLGLTMPTTLLTLADEVIE